MPRAKSTASASGGRKRAGRRKTSWLTTDAYEVELREERARTEPMTMRPPAQGEDVFGDYTVVPRGEAKSGREYLVELRTLEGPGNYCTCRDYAKNFLGTCKHVEKVRQHARLRAGLRNRSSLVEVFVHPRPGSPPEVQLPPRGRGKWHPFLSRYLDATRRFKAPWQDTLQAFLRDLDSAPAAVAGKIRVSRGVRVLADRLAETTRAQLARQRFSDGFDAESFLRFPLYDYQREGMLHLAFAGRALLTDEMGLGKTVQAVAAAKVLRDLYRIGRVLIVCPASLKAEWEEQIRKFTSLTCRVIYGLRPRRLAQYRQAREFFLVTNYEQIIRDEREINDCLQPDLIILDEAQRIKNWKTKTAQAVKRLQSRYAFVLTGTPLENRIDEVYSLVDFVDDRLLGSLFRFNREFYNFDEDGRVLGMKNLRRLHERLGPVMLRRRKSDIEDQLPERLDNNYFVQMTAEQQNRYAEYEYQVGILSNIARRRPLSPQEFEKLQRCLACMRMLCDSVYILDPKIRTAPKVDELCRVLADIWSNDRSRKVLVFSEWVRMLDLVRERLEEDDIGYAWHVGSVPQQKRRHEIRRFKEDPDCNVFLSSDSGSLGLNLQAASVVVNLDLPWNPAKLEQRIARAWRKHQPRAVNVINFVAEKTIEHRMLATLGYKQRLADVVLDGSDDWEQLERTDAKSRYMERLSQVLDTPLAAPAAEPVAEPAAQPSAAPQQPDLPPAERFRQAAGAVLGDELSLCKVTPAKDGQRLKRVFGVGKRPEDATGQVRGVLQTSGHDADTVDITVLAPAQFALLRELARKGLISFNDAGMEELIRAESLTEPEPDDALRRRQAAEPHLGEAARSVKMARVLAAGGFPLEATAPARKALDQSAPVFAILTEPELPTSLPEGVVEVQLDAVRRGSILSQERMDFIQALPERLDDEPEALAFVESAAGVVEELEAAVTRLAV